MGDGAEGQGHPEVVRRVRRTGWVLIGIGGILVALIACLSTLAYQLRAGGIPGPDEGTEPINWPPLIAFLAFFGLFGTLTLTTGIWQVWFGRLNWRLVYLMLVLGAVFFAAGMLAQAYMGGRTPLPRSLP